MRESGIFQDFNVCNGGLAHNSPANHNEPTLQPVANNAKTVESLTGLIERVTYFNDENGYAVIKVKAKGHRDLVTVVGSLASVSAGEWVIAQGVWIRDREFGLQFRAEMLTSTPPTRRVARQPQALRKLPPCPAPCTQLSLAIRG